MILIYRYALMLFFMLNMSTVMLNANDGKALDNSKNTTKSRYTKKISKIGKSPKGKNNIEFYISLGTGISRTCYDTAGLNAKLYTITGHILLEDKKNPKQHYSMPYLVRPATIYYPGVLLWQKPDLSYENIDEKGFLINSNQNIDFTYIGSTLPIQFGFNYCLFRRFKIGIAYELMMNFYYYASSNKLCKFLYDYDKHTDVCKESLIKRFEEQLVKNKRVSWSNKLLAVLALKIFEYDLNSIWIHHRSGFMWHMGMKPLGNFCYSGYNGYLGINIEKYLSAKCKFFYGFGAELAHFTDPTPFGDKCNGAAKLSFDQLTFFNVSAGFAFGTNDGYYDDYTEQLKDDNYYLDKYNRTFEYYDEFYNYNL